MNITSQTVKSAAYFCLWVFAVFVGWFLWFYILDSIIGVGSLLLPLVFGTVVGTLSGFSPKKAFLACFIGFFTIALLSIPPFPRMAIGVALYGGLGGLFAMAGAILKRIFSHQKIEELDLKPWQWILLIGGANALADYFVLFGMYFQLFVYDYVSSFIQLLVPALICLFALGIYAGSFCRLEYKNLIKFTIEASLGGHICVLMYVIYLFLINHTSWRSFVMIPFMALYLLVLYKGVQFGYQFRDSKLITDTVEGKDSSSANWRR